MAKKQDEKFSSVSENVEELERLYTPGSNIHRENPFRNY